MDDLRADPDQELVHRVHVGPLAGAEADVVEADAKLREALVAPTVLRLDDADRRPSAHAVEHAVHLEDGLRRALARNARSSSVTRPSDTTSLTARSYAGRAMAARIASPSLSERPSSRCRSPP